MKVVNKITGKDVTKDVITSIEKGLIAQGYKMFKVKMIDNGDGTYTKIKTPITHD